MVGFHEVDGRIEFEAHCRIKERGRQDDEDHRRSGLRGLVLVRCPNSTGEDLIGPPFFDTPYYRVKKRGRNTLVPAFAPITNQLVCYKEKSKPPGYVCLGKLCAKNRSLLQAQIAYQGTAIGEFIRHRLRSLLRGACRGGGPRHGQTHDGARRLLTLRGRGHKHRKGVLAPVLPAEEVAGLTREGGC